MPEIPSPLESLCGRHDLAAAHFAAGDFELYAGGVPDHEGFTPVTCKADQTLEPLRGLGWSPVTSIPDHSGGGVTLIMRKVR